MRSMSSPQRFRFVAGLITIAAIVLLGWLCWRGARVEALDDALVRLAADPWGLATLVDLALGLTLVAAWMIAVEARPWRLLLWLPLLAVGGNLATALYLLLRLRRADDLRSWLTARR